MSSGGASTSEASKRLELSPDEVAKYAAHEGDILMVRTNGNPDYVGTLRPRAAPDEQMVFASYLIRIAIDQSVLEPALSRCCSTRGRRGPRFGVPCDQAQATTNINSKDPGHPASGS